MKKNTYKMKVYCYFRKLVPIAEKNNITAPCGIKNNITGPVA